MRLNQNLQYCARFLSRFIIVMMLVFVLFNCAGKPAVTPDENTQKQLTAQQELILQLQDQLQQQQTRFDTKLKILEDRSAYSDSLYFEVQAEFESLLERITHLENMSVQMSSAAGLPGGTSFPAYNDDEYRAAYIDALAQYQNGDFTGATKQFSQLIASDRDHELADNCQYWLGEISYAKKDYRQALDAFERVFSFPGTNKADHAQFKMGLCYLNIGETQKAKAAFVTHITNYPNSELYSRSKEYIEQN